MKPKETWLFPPEEEQFPICYRLEPEKRATPQFDNCSIAQFPVAEPGEMGMQVLDNCCEEHGMS